MSGINLDEFTRLEPNENQRRGVAFKLSIHKDHGRFRFNKAVREDVGESVNGVSLFVRGDVVVFRFVEEPYHSDYFNINYRHAGLAFYSRKLANDFTEDLGDLKSTVRYKLTKEEDKTFSVNFSEDIS